MFFVLVHLLAGVKMSQARHIACYYFWIILDIKISVNGTILVGLDKRVVFSAWNKALLVNLKGRIIEKINLVTYSHC